MFNVKVANNGGQQEIKFPDDDDDLMSFNITSENYPKIYFARSDLNAFSSGRVAIVNTLITKVADYLYNDFETRYMYNTILHSTKFLLDKIIVVEILLDFIFAHLQTFIQII